MTSSEGTVLMAISIVAGLLLAAFIVSLLWITNPGSASKNLVEIQKKECLDSGRVWVITRNSQRCL